MDRQKEIYIERKIDRELGFGLLVWFHHSTRINTNSHEGYSIFIYLQRQTDRQEDRQTERQTDRQTDKQTDRQKDR